MRKFSILTLGFYFYLLMSLTSVSESKMTDKELYEELNDILGEIGVSLDELQEAIFPSTNTTDDNDSIENEEFRDQQKEITISEKSEDSMCLDENDHCKNLENLLEVIRNNTLTVINEDATEYTLSDLKNNNKDLEKINDDITDEDNLLGKLNNDKFSEIITNTKNEVKKGQNKSGEVAKDLEDSEVLIIILSVLCGVFGLFAIGSISYVLYNKFKKKPKQLYPEINHGYNKDETDRRYVDPSAMKQADAGNSSGKNISSNPLLRNSDKVEVHGGSQLSHRPITGGGENTNSNWSVVKQNLGSAPLARNAMHPERDTRQHHEVSRPRVNVQRHNDRSDSDNEYIPMGQHPRSQRLPRQPSAEQLPRLPQRNQSPGYPNTPARYSSPVQNRFGQDRGHEPRVNPYPDPTVEMKTRPTNFQSRQPQTSYNDDPYSIESRRAKLSTGTMY